MRLGEGESFMQNLAQYLPLKAKILTFSLKPDNEANPTNKRVFRYNCYSIVTLKKFFLVGETLLFGDFLSEMLCFKNDIQRVPQMVSFALRFLLNPENFRHTVNCSSLLSLN